MAIQARGRVTFHKIVDGRTINFMLAPSISTQQIMSKDPVSYVPDYTQTNLVLVPVLTISGSGGENKVSGTCAWYLDNYKIVSGQSGFTVKTSSADKFALVLGQNLKKSSSVIRCEYTYVDPDTGASQQCTAVIQLSQVENAGTSIIAVMDTPLSVFTTVAGVAKDVRVSGHMVRGGAVDNTNVAYSWEIQGTDGNYKTITAATAPAGSGLPGGNLFSGWNTDTLTVNSNAVLNISNVRLTIKDTDPNSSTFNKSCSAVGTIIDMTDSYDLDGGSDKSISTAHTNGVPLEWIMKQGGKVWEDGSYTGKTIGFYRLTDAEAKDATWAPASSDFPGWTVANNEVKRTFNTQNGLGTSANRTVRIRYSHMRTGIDTKFEAFIDF